MTKSNNNLNALNVILDEISNEVECIVNNINKNYNNVSEELNVMYMVYDELKSYDIEMSKIKERINKIESLKDNIKILMRNKMLSNDSNSSIQNNKKEDLSLEYINIHGYMPDNPMPCITSNSILDSEYMINSPIYFSKDSNKFLIKINNKVISGNLIDFYNLSELRNNYCNKIFKCKYNTKEECKSKKKYVNCKFYHNNETPNVLFNDVSKINISKRNLKNIKKIDISVKETIEKCLMHYIILYQIYC